MFFFEKIVIFKSFVFQCCSFLINLFLAGVIFVRRLRLSKRYRKLFFVLSKCFCVFFTRQCSATVLLASPLSCRLLWCCWSFTIQILRNNWTIRKGVGCVGWWLVSIQREDFPRNRDRKKLAAQIYRVEVLSFLLLKLFGNYLCQGWLIFKFLFGGRWTGCRQVSKGTRQVLSAVNCFSSLTGPELVHSIIWTVIFGRGVVIGEDHGVESFSLLDRQIGQQSWVCLQRDRIEMSGLSLILAWNISKPCSRCYLKQLIKFFVFTELWGVRKVEWSERNGLDK